MIISANSSLKSLSHKSPSLIYAKTVMTISAFNTMHWCVIQLTISLFPRKRESTEGGLGRRLTSETGSERLEILRNQLDDLRARAANGAEKQATMEAVLAWAGEVGDGLDEMTPEQRKAVLQLVLENAIIDKHNQVRINLAIPAEVPVSIASASSAWT